MVTLTPGHITLIVSISLVAATVISQFACFHSQVYENQTESEYNSPPIERHHQNDDDNIKPTAQKIVQPTVPISTQPPVNVDDIWVGDVSEVKLPPIKASIVVNYCQGDLGWVYGYIAGHQQNIRNLTLITKCGGPIPAGNLWKTAEIIELPNVGRNDQSIAYQMSRIAENRGTTDYDDNIVMVFLKDNIAVHRKKSRPSTRSLHDMIHSARLRGFACFQRPNRGFSLYHNTTVLRSFHLKRYRKKDASFNNGQFKSPYANMSQWLDAINIALPSPIVPVCYGGSFAVRVSQILATPKETWVAIDRSLSRGDNIEEGHYVERSWAGILSPPIFKDVQEKILQRASRVNYRGGEVGALIANRR